MQVAFTLALAGLLTAAAVARAEELHNWFDDPFMQLTAQASACPTPAGPFVNQQDRLLQSHRRAEKGTTAWLAGEAERPKAYAYDAEIASSVLAAFKEDSARFAGSSLWATVQGRVVYIEGCVANESEATALEDLIRSLPNVQQAIVIVRTGAASRVPYRVMPSPTCAAAPC